MHGIVRLAFGVCLALLANACHEPVSPPLAPTPNVAAALTVTGVVSDGTRAIEGANVSAWIDEGTLGYSYMWARGPLLTDAAGRYQLTSLPAGVKVWLETWKAGYIQQCAAPQVTLLADTRVDLQLVLRASLAGSSAQAPVASGFRSVSGVIFEDTGSGKRPVSGAFVDFEPLMDFVAAATISDADGRYMLCGIPEGQPAFIGAGLSGRVTYVSVPAGQSTGIDISLP